MYYIQYFILINNKYATVTEDAVYENESKNNRNSNGRNSFKIYEKT